MYECMQVVFGVGVERAREIDGGSSAMCSGCPKLIGAQGAAQPGLPEQTHTGALAQPGPAQPSPALGPSESGLQRL